ncbi:MAG TPA: hypothetical protein VJ841_03020 [Candidatus Saccharimonadales bacterium]|nr:hypothetical protein [Candidatus Saccharimonadales bacterium]
MEYRGEQREAEEYDSKLERMVDSGIYSYELARLALGTPPYELDTRYGASLNELPASREDPVEIALDSYDVSREPEAAYNHLLSAELPPVGRKSPEQLSRDRQGRERVRVAMHGAQAA